MQGKSHESAPCSGKGPSAPQISIAPPSLPRFSTAPLPALPPGPQHTSPLRVSGPRSHRQEHPGTNPPHAVIREVAIRADLVTGANGQGCAEREEEDKEREGDKQAEA